MDDLEDRFSEYLTMAMELLSLKKPPEDEAMSMMEEYGHNALSVAEICIEMMKKTNEQEIVNYWEKVRDYIECQSTRH